MATATGGADSPSYTLDSHELRFLSVVKPMTFLMAAEFDLFLAGTRTRGAEIAVRFPALPVDYRRALAFCAARFGLTTDPAPPAENAPPSVAAMTVRGTAKLPLLRYVDFLPGRLHLDEILSVVGMSITRTEPAPSAVAVDGIAAGNVYDACCTDYTAYEGDEPKFEAGSFFATIDLGLPLATMAHIMRFEVAKIASASDALKSFQRFSHWNKFDLRWDDEDTKRAAVVVMPSTADVHEIFDRYEDEPIDDEATLLFRLSPVAPCTHVPYLEDALIRRVREQQWDEVKAAWALDKRFSPAPTLVVANLSNHGSLHDMLGPFGAKDVVVDAALVMDDGPHKRRKLYLNFATPEAARAALALDGQRVAGLPGKPVVRVQVAPPYMSAARRGNLLSSLRSRSPSPQPSGPSAVPEVTAGKGGKGGKGAKPEPKGAAAAAATAAKLASRDKGSKSRSPQAGPTAPPADAAEPSKPAQGGRAAAEKPAKGAAAKKAEAKVEAAAPTAKKGESAPLAPARAMSSKSAAAAAPAEKKPAPKQAGDKKAPAADAKAPAAAAAAKDTAKPTEKAAAAAAPASATTSPARHADPADGGMKSPALSSDAPMQREQTARPESGGRSPGMESTTKLNSAAAPFVPRMGSPNSSFAGPPPPPPSYNATPLAGSALPPPPPPYMSPGVGPAPPPYMGMSAPPPAYGSSPITAGMPAQPPPYAGTPIASVTPAVPPPAYASPPSYAPPPRYDADKKASSSSDDIKA